MKKIFNLIILFIFIISFLTFVSAETIFYDDFNSQVVSDSLWYNIVNGAGYSGYPYNNTNFFRIGTNISNSSNNFNIKFNFSENGASTPVMLMLDNEDFTTSEDDILTFSYQISTNRIFIDSCGIDSAILMIDGYSSGYNEVEFKIEDGVIYSYLNNVFQSYADVSECFLNKNLSAVRLYIPSGSTFKYNDFYIYTDSESNFLTGLPICPLTNCLFYDDFVYPDNSFLSDSDLNYNGNDDIIEIINESSFFYVNDSLAPYFNNNFFDDDDYIIVDSIFKFSPTTEKLSDTLDYRPLIYEIKTYSTTGDLINDFYIGIEKYSNYTYQVFVYYLDGAIPKGVLSKTINSENGFSIGQTFDDSQQKIFYRFSDTNPFIDTFYSPSTDYLLSANNIDSFSIIRADYNNESEAVYSFGLDYFYFYGLDQSITSDDDYINSENVSYLDFDNTTDENSILPNTDIASEFNGIANLLGFKSDLSLFLFAVIIIGIIIYLIFSISPEQVNTTAKTILASFIVISGIYFFWKIGFIPTIFFTFIIFVLALIGAFIFYKMSKSE